jgi:TolA-binding protein
MSSSESILLAKINYWELVVTLPTEWKIVLGLFTVVLLAIALLFLIRYRGCKKGKKRATGGDGHDSPEIIELKKEAEKKNRQLEEKDNQIEKKNRQIEEKESQIEKKNRQIEEKERQIEEKNEELVNVNGKLEEKTNELQIFESHIYPRFIAESEDEIVSFMRDNVKEYFTKERGDTEQSALGGLSGQLNLWGALLASPQHKKELHDAIHKTSRFFVQYLEELASQDGEKTDPQEIREWLDALATDFNPQLQKLEIKLRVPEICAPADATWMSFTPGNGIVNIINTWCLADMNGTAIIKANVDC